MPTIVLHGEANGVGPASSSEGHARFFSGPNQRRVLPSVGHNVPQEAPEAFASAVEELLASG